MSIFLEGCQEPVPLEAFALFNRLRAAGEIAIVPASGV